MTLHVPVQSTTVYSRKSGMTAGAAPDTTDVGGTCVYHSRMYKGALRAEHRVGAPIVMMSEAMTVRLFCMRVKR